jgi:hypothetical protein
MTTELDVLGLVSDRLSASSVPFMLTGSFALAYYATPRMTRDLVWALQSNSELQRRDIQQLLVGAIDLDYIRRWAPQLGVTTLLDELLP